jgi:hypothetical protein
VIIRVIKKILSDNFLSKTRKICSQRVLSDTKIVRSSRPKCKTGTKGKFNEVIDASWAMGYEREYGMRMNIVRPKDK